MKTLWLTLLFIGLSVITQAQQPASRRTPTTYLLVLSLDDRLLKPAQIEQDTALARAFLQSFVEQVRRRELFMKHSLFTVVVAEQFGMPEAINKLASQLTLDLSLIPLANRVTAVEQFEQRFPGALLSLYRAAMQGRTRREQFAGTDLYRCLNNHPDLFGKPGATALLLNDGYLDFQNNQPVLTVGNRSSATHRVLQTLRAAGPRYPELIPDHGILNLEQRYPDLRVFMAELRPDKNQGVLEARLLTSLWSDFWRRTGVRNVELSLSGNKEIAKHKMRDFLALKPKIQ